MIDAKSVLRSKTVWGGAIVVLSQITKIAGYDISDEDVAAIVDDITTIVTILSGLFAIYGRIHATKTLTLPSTKEKQ